jgi:hypothetical protein
MPDDPYLQAADQGSHGISRCHDFAARVQPDDPSTKLTFSSYTALLQRNRSVIATARCPHRQVALHADLPHNVSLGRQHTEPPEGEVVGKQSISARKATCAQAPEFAGTASSPANDAMRAARDVEHVDSIAVEGGDGARFRHGCIQ